MPIRTAKTEIPVEEGNMRLNRRCVLTTAVLAIGVLAWPRYTLADEREGTKVRWDIIRLSLPGATVNPGGEASAKDNLGVPNTITLTGSGTFVAPAGGKGTSNAVTGGGTWRITTATGPLSGAYKVTGLVRWEEAPGTFPGTDDKIGSPANFRPGLAVLRIQYSDGSHGILVVSCHGALTPDTVFEGVTASKDYVDFWNRVPPSGTPATANANRTAFHLVSEDEEDDK
jgi:hypothetical protein